MHSFITKDVNSIQDYNLYCHYVAGIVGQGLTRLFVAYKLNNLKDIDNDIDLSNQMGLFLQKVNIIRDFIQDIYEERVFWPKHVYSKYVDSLEEFKKIENRHLAVKCANDLIDDALTHIPSCLEYLKRIYNEEQKNKTQGIFTFCAIPQVMAIATLYECYNNPKMFDGVLKIKKGLACRIMLETKTIDSVYKFFDEYLDMFYCNKKLNVIKYKNLLTHEIINSNNNKIQNSNFLHVLKDLYILFIFLILIIVLIFMTMILYNFKKN